MSETVRVWPELWKRRVPYFVGGYIAATAGIVQFVDWLVSRYALSPALTDLVLAGLALLLPTAVMLAWRHGEAGRNHWTRIEWIGVPLNVVAATAVLLIAFGGRSLGATTTTVLVEDEGGNEVEAVVAKSEFRRHVALFPFDNESGDREKDWLQYGLPRGLWADWRQDIYLDVRESEHMAEAFRRNGRPGGLDLPLALQGEIAGDQHVGYFLAGAITGASGDTLAVRTSLYEVGTNRLVEERTHEGTPFEVIDEISRQVREDLGLPDERLSETADLPLRELLTESEEAYRAYVEAYRAVALESDYAAALEHAARAVERDSSFALAHWLRYAAAAYANQGDVARASLEAAMEHRYRLPQREQYYVRREYHGSLRQDPERALQLAEMSVSVNPEDIEARLVLALYYQVRDRIDDAVAQYLEVLRVAPTQTQALLAVGQLYAGQGDYERSIEHLGRYAELEPEQTQVYPLLASAYRAQGRFDEARAECERPLLLEPEDVGAQVCLGEIAADRGRWDEAERQFETAFGSARTAAERVQVYQARGAYYLRRGRIDDAIRERAAELPELGPAGLPPVAILQRRFSTLARFVLAGRPGTAIDSAAILAERFESPFDRMAPFGEIGIYGRLEDAEGLERAVEEAELAVEELRLDVLRPAVVAGRGRLLELRGDCEAALVEFRRVLELEPARSGSLPAARCLRKLGRLEEAASELDALLVPEPYAPEALVELARVEAARDNPDVARGHLERALEVWSAADPGFEPAAEARDLLASLPGGSGGTAGV